MPLSKSSPFSFLSIILFFSIVFNAALSSGDFVTPNATELVIRENSNLSLTCSFAFQGGFENSSFYIRWNLRKGDIGDKYKSWAILNDTHSESYLTATHLKIEDTNVFSCTGNTDNGDTFIIHQYFVYIFTDTNFLVVDEPFSYFENVNDGEYVFVFDSGQPVIRIPCRPTHPDVTPFVIHLNIRRNLFIANGENAEVLRDSESRWNFEPLNGLVLNNPSDNDTGQYLCSGTLNNVTNHKRFTLLFKGEDNGYLQMFPSVEQQVIEAGSHLTITCTYAYEDEFTHIYSKDMDWGLPGYSYAQLNGGQISVSKLKISDERVHFTSERNETHLTGTLTLKDARPDDTGLFSCEESIRNRITHQYIYVYSDTDLITMDHPSFPRNEYLFVFEIAEKDDIRTSTAVVTIPCKATHPDVNLTISRKKDFYGILVSNGTNPFKDTPAEEEIYIANSNWTFDGKSGLTLFHPSHYDIGHYECVGTLNNITDKKKFTLMAVNVRGEQLQMFPDVENQVIEAGSNVTITCIYNTEYTPKKTHQIFWTFPSYLVNYEPSNTLRDDVQHHFDYTFARNFDFVLSTMTITDVQPEYTGYYGCETNVNQLSNATVKQYVYAYSSHELIFNDNRNQKDYFVFDYWNNSATPGGILEVSFKPTHPDVSFSLVRRSNNTAENFTDSKDLLSGPDAKWFFKSYPERGLALKNPRVGDSGKYKCIASMKNNITDEKSFEIYILGMELERVGDSKDLIEGDNVSLICRTLIQVLHTSPPEWAYQIDDSGEMQVINETNPPEGIQITTIRTEIFMDYLKDEIYDEESYSREFYYHESRMDLFDVNSNTSRIYQCRMTGSPLIEDYALNISIRVNGKYEINKGNILTLERGKPENLTCNLLPDTPVQWFKDGIEYSGSVYSSDDSSVLPLQGIAEEIGNYSCRWNNSMGQTRSKNFTVLAEFIEESQMNIIIGLSVTFAIALLIGIGIPVKMYLNKKRQEEEIVRLFYGNLKGNISNIPIDYQIEFLPYDKRWEFPRNRLKLGETLAEGFFGKIVKGEATGISRRTHLYSDPVKTVAVKMIKLKNDIIALDALINELKILIYLGEHPNVVDLLGACTRKKTMREILIIFEYYQYGNLKNYLTNYRSSYLNLLEETGEVPPGLNYNDLTVDSYCLFTSHLISWSLQIARGMEYLASKNVLHGDLAARNILLADDGVAKVSDFGLSLKMRDDQIVQLQKKMPIKWMAVESLADDIFSTQSDVWSYGVLLWELFSLGENPYPEMKLFNVIENIRNGYRMDKPELMPNFFGKMMANCWKEKPSERPTFNLLVNRITDYMEGTDEFLYLYLDSQCINLEEERVTTTPTYHPESSPSDTEGHMQIVTAQIHFHKDLDEISADVAESFHLVGMDYIDQSDLESPEENDTLLSCQENISTTQLPQGESQQIDDNVITSELSEDNSKLEEQDCTEDDFYDILIELSPDDKSYHFMNKTTSEDESDSELQQ